MQGHVEIWCICWLQGLKMLLWTSTLVCCIKVSACIPQNISCFFWIETHIHIQHRNKFESSYTNVARTTEGDKIKCCSPFTLPMQWKKCWAHGNVLVLRREQEELIIIQKLSKNSTPWQLFTDRCSHHLTLDILSLIPPCTFTEERQVPKMDSLYHPAEVSFSFRVPRFLRAIPRTPFIVSFSGSWAEYVLLFHSR